MEISAVLVEYFAKLDLQCLTYVGAIIFVYIPPMTREFAMAEAGDQEIIPPFTIEGS